MRRILRALVVSASLSPVAITASPAHAGGGDVAAGIIGGLAAGTLLGATMGKPRYYEPPPPAYVVPEPVDGPDCYWAGGEPYWDDYRGAWVHPRVTVCE